MGATCSSANAVDMGGKNSKDSGAFDSIEEDARRGSKESVSNGGRNVKGENPYSNVSTGTASHTNDVASDDSSTKKLVPTHKDAVNDIVLHVGQSKTTPTLLTCSDDKSIALQALGSTEDAAKRWSGHSKPVNKVVCNEKFIFSCSRDLKIKQWVVDSPDACATYEGHTLTVTALGIRSDGTRIASGSRDTTIRVWDVATGKQRARNSTPRNLVTCLQWFPDNSSLLAQGSEDLSLRIWDVRTSVVKASQTFKGYVYFPLCLDISPDGNEILTGSKGFNGVGCEVRVWDVRAGKVRLELNGHEQDVKACKFLTESPGRVITGSKDKTVRVWNIASGVNGSSRMVHNYKMYGDGAFAAMCVVGQQAQENATVVYTGAALDGTPEMFSACIPCF